MFAIDNVGQEVRKGQVVARLSDAALRVKIAHSRAKLEKAEFQYQAILMGQGYKHDNLDAAPENIKKMARISSGYVLLYHYRPHFWICHQNSKHTLWYGQAG